MNIGHVEAAVLASGITISIFTPYLIGIRRGSIRPHVISWVIWGLTTLLVGGGQWLGGGGVGAVPILLSGVLSMGVAGLTFLYRRRGQVDSRVTRFDGWSLGIVLACIPLWLMTGNERWSMLVLTTIDLIGFGPTLRAAWRDPHAESALLFAAFATRNAVAIAGLESLHLSTVVFPGVIGVACLSVVFLIVIRRQTISKPSL
jgi:hypothetical protein